MSQKNEDFPIWRQVLLKAWSYNKVESTVIIQHITYELIIGSPFFEV